VIRLEAWWEGGTATLARRQQLQREEAEAAAWQRVESGRPVNYLPHAQMPKFWEPVETVLVAIRVTFARGLSQVSCRGGCLRGDAQGWFGALDAGWSLQLCPWAFAPAATNRTHNRKPTPNQTKHRTTTNPNPHKQVIGNETAASTTSPRAAYAFQDGESIRRLTIWSSERSLDGATMTPLVGGLSFSTSLKGGFMAGEPPSALPQQQGGGAGAAVPPSPLAAAAAAAGKGGGGATAARGLGGPPAAGGAAGGLQQQQQQRQQQQLKGQLFAGGGLDPVLIGGTNVTLTSQQLGTGLLVGAGAFTSGSAINALGLIFVQGGRDATEL